MQAYYGVLCVRTRPVEGQTSPRLSLPAATITAIEPQAIPSIVRRHSSLEGSRLTISLKERFLVQAPIQAVWEYLLDPNRVVGCMPGATLEEIVDDGTFLGSVKVAVGPITTSYKGRVQFTEKDETNRRIQLAAEGREGSGGTARGTMSSEMRATEDGQTEVSVDVTVDVTGRIVQIGRGLMQDVASDMFGQFVRCVTARLESAEPAAKDEAPPPVKPVAIVPLVLRAVWSAVVRLVRGVLRRPARK